MKVLHLPTEIAGAGQPGVQEVSGQSAWMHIILPGLTHMAMQLIFIHG